MKSLEQKILDAADIISKAGRNGNGNWVVVGPEYGRMLNEMLEQEEQRRRLKERRLKIEKLKSKL